MLRTALLSLVLLLAGCPGPAASTDAGGDAPLPVNGGIVQISDYTGAASQQLIALFGEASPDDLERAVLPGCTQIAAGDCVSVTCSGVTPATYPAGTLTLSYDGTSVGTVTRSSSGTYASPITTALGEGDVVAVSATGASGGVPAFTASVTAPAAPDTTLPTTASMSTPLVLTWDPSLTADRVAVSLVSTTAGGALVTCVADATQGTISVPPIMLDDLPAGDAVIAVSGVSSSDVVAGDFAVRLRAIRGVAGSITLTLGP